MGRYRRAAFFEIAPAPKKGACALTSIECSKLYTFSLGQIPFMIDVNGSSEGSFCTISHILGSHVPDACATLGVCTFNHFRETTCHPFHCLISLTRRAKGHAR